MPPIPIERMNGSGSSTMLEQADRDRRAGDDDRPAGVRHRLDEGFLDVPAPWWSSSRKRKIISSE